MPGRPPDVQPTCSIIRGLIEASPRLATRSWPFRGLSGCFLTREDKPAEMRPVHCLRISRGLEEEYIHATLVWVVYGCLN